MNDQHLRKMSFGPPLFTFPDGSNLRCVEDRWEKRAHYRAPWESLTVREAMLLIWPYMWK